MIAGQRRRPDFSDASTLQNDENMLVIRGNKRVADIYLGEYMRLWNHYAFREFLANSKKPSEAQLQFLRTDDWWKQYSAARIAAASGNTSPARSTKPRSPDFRRAALSARAV